MALIKCGECGREVSDKAATCPGCGAPIAAAQSAEASSKQAAKGGKSFLNQNIGCGGLLALGLLGLLVIGMCSDDTSPRQSASIPANSRSAGDIPPAVRQWELVGTSGQMRFVLIEETQEQNQAVYHHAIEDLCAGESFCYILFWSDAELVPTSMPMTDAQVAGQKASYSFNKSTGHRKLLWSCEIVNDPTQCFTPEFD